MDTVIVIIKFIGTAAIKDGVVELSVPVSKNVENGLMDINKIVREKAGSQFLYTVLINGISQHLTKKKEFEPEDEISIVPIVLGG